MFPRVFNWSKRMMITGTWATIGGALSTIAGSRTLGPVILTMGVSTIVDAWLFRRIVRQDIGHVHKYATVIIESRKNE